MEIIREIREGDWVLTHSWYADDFGLRRNLMDLFNEKTRTHYPFIAPIRVSNYSPDKPIEGDDVSPFTDEEYAEMLKANH